MEHELLYQPSYSTLRVRMQPGETIKAEAGAMVSMSDGIELETKAQGGLLKSLKRSVLGGESFFVNTYTANAPGEALFAPALPGDVTAIGLQGRTIYAQSGAYMVSTMDVEIDTSWGGAKTFFSGEGLFLLRMTGHGNVFLSSYGAIHAIDLEPGQKYTVDTGHIVAFSEGVGYSVRRIGGLKSTLFSGEGLVCDMTGPGRIWLQTRSADSLLAWLTPQLGGQKEHSSGGSVRGLLDRL